MGSSFKGTLYYGDLQNQSRKTNASDVPSSLSQLYANVFENYTTLITIAELLLEACDDTQIGKPAAVSFVSYKLYPTPDAR